jgi:hypothetical protein
MKRVFTVLASLVVLLFLLSLAYRLSWWSKRTTTLRVELSIEGPKGHRAILVNDGYLPLVVGRCDTISDAMQPDTRVGDAIQRWDTQRGIWVTAYQRSDCRLVPTGVIEAIFSHKMLWPGGRLHTSPFFHSYLDTAIHAGDKVRFLVFTQGTESDSPSIPSQSFVVASEE